MHLGRVQNCFASFAAAAAAAAARSGPLLGSQPNAPCGAFSAKFGFDHLEGVR